MHASLQHSLYSRSNVAATNCLVAPHMWQAHSATMHRSSQHKSSVCLLATPYPCSTSCTLSRSRSTGGWEPSGAWQSTSVTRPLPSMAPITFGQYYTRVGSREGEGWECRPVGVWKTLDGWKDRQWRQRSVAVAGMRRWPMCSMVHLRKM